MTEPVRVLARAKVNLCLHVTGRRSDGYHLLDSLVVFPRMGDVIEAEKASRTSLTITGPFGIDLSAGADNLVLRGAALMPGNAALRLHKNLPASSGIGGGSADAAATLRALSQLHGNALPSAEQLLGLGADVPVCLSQTSIRMRGIGDVLEPLPPLPEFWCVLVNPGSACPTPDVFAALERFDHTPLPAVPGRFTAAEDLFTWLRSTRNDLQLPATRLCPQVAVVSAAIAETEGCALNRMSGSGATCFGLYATGAAALKAADMLRASYPAWWIAAAPVSDDPRDNEVREVDQDVTHVRGG